MIHSKMRLGLVAILALSGAAVAANANGTSADAAAFACGVSTQTQQGLLVIEGVLKSPSPMTGEYRFTLKSHGNGGSSNISQGGQFSATANTSVSLGRVMVNAGSAIDVNLAVTSDGRTFDCSQQFAAQT